MFLIEINKTPDKKIHLFRIFMISGRLMLPNKNTKRMKGQHFMIIIVHHCYAPSKCEFYFARQISSLYALFSWLIS